MGAIRNFQTVSPETVWKIRISSLPDSRECSKRAKKGQFAALGVIK